MARGGGGSSSHRSSGGGHSMSHSSGGHHVSRSHTNISSRTSSHTTYHPTSRSSSHRTRPMGGPYVSNRYTVVSTGGNSNSIIAFVFTIMLFITIFGFFISTSGNSSGSIPASTQTRVKLESGNSYINDCVQVEGSVFEVNETRLETELKDFYNTTGVQPYIIIKDYEPSLQTDAEKEQWTVDYYDNNFTREDIFLYVYFQQENEANASEAGYMTYAMGNQVDSVMDSEAIEIFWSYIDKYWYSNCTETDLFANAFNDTANRIMEKSTTVADLLKYLVIFCIVIAIGITAVVLISKKHKREKEKAAEDERILNTSVNDIVQDDLTEKYL